MNTCRWCFVLISNSFDITDSTEICLSNVLLSDNTTMPYFTIKIYRGTYERLSTSPVIEQKGMTVKTTESNSVIFFLRFNGDNDFLYSVKCDFNNPNHRKILDQLLFMDNIYCRFLDKDSKELGTFIYPNLLKCLIKNYKKYYYCYDKTEYTEYELNNFMKIISIDTNKRIISFEKAFYLP